MMSQDCKPTSRVELSPKRIRLVFAGKIICDSRTAKYHWDQPYYPTYYFPRVETNMKYLRPSESGNLDDYDIVVGTQVQKKAAKLDRRQQLEDCFSFVFDKLDAWFEEEEEIYVHARDPYKRIDIAPCSRHIEVYLDGHKLCDTRSAHLLFETGLITRYYIPKLDCNLQALKSSKQNTTTKCPYKGVAEYYDLHCGKSEVRPANICPDGAWWYRYPTAESMKIQGMVCFYNERVDFYIDGVHQKQPTSAFV